jgi:hypothetical protein
MDATIRRLCALLILGLVVFLSPIMGAFNRLSFVFGLPLLPTYLFACWAAIVVAAALFSRGRGR